MSEIKNGGLDQYGPKPFNQQQFGTAGIEAAKLHCSVFVVCKKQRMSYGEIISSVVVMSAIVTAKMFAGDDAWFFTVGIPTFLTQTDQVITNSNICLAL